jgi:nucleoside-diphosphate-sugar epimerase
VEVTEETVEALAREIVAHLEATVVVMEETEEVMEENVEATKEIVEAMGGIVVAVVGTEAVEAMAMEEDIEEEEVSVAAMEIIEVSKLKKDRKYIIDLKFLG